MNKNIKSQLETVESVFVATFNVLDAMADGERVQLKELAKTVALAVAMEPKRALHFVNDFVHNSDIVYVTRGKKGGIVKGVKPAKVVKAKKDVTDSVNSVDGTDDQAWKRNW